MRKSLKAICFIVIVCIYAYLGISFFLLKSKDYILLIVTSILSGLIASIFISYDAFNNETSKAIEDSIDKAVSETLKEGSIGIVVYDEDYVITWMSPFFKNKNIDKVNEKLLIWIPDLQDVITGNIDRTVVSIGEEKYSVYKNSENNYLMFKDVTEENNLRRKIEEDSYVFGLLNYDNYDEYRENDDEIAFINSNIKVPVIDYLKKYNVVYKTTRSSKMLLILNEKSYRNLLKDQFSILNVVRNESKKGDIDITLSMAFASGSENLFELDNEAQELLELAQSRGGDQVACRKLGQDVIYFGGSSEAKEKRSKTKIRVIASSIKDCINKASNVMIVGHKDADADCIGAMLVMSNIALSLNKKAYILLKSGGKDPMIADVLNRYNNILTVKHNFVSESEAVNLYNDDSLVIMLDHHLASQSNGSELLHRAKKIIIIDHHRRKADLDLSPIMIYLEAASSSTCELMMELLTYMPKKIEIKDEEANIIYLGILIDTNRFRVRTGARTFDVVKTLRSIGADPIVCDEISKEPYEVFNKRSQLINSGKRYGKNIVIAPNNTGNYNRTIVSQACDELLKIKDIDAAFVICNSDKEEVIVSARSNDNINVQTILEKMNGGGHRNAAGLQRKDSSVSKVTTELVSILDEIIKGGSKNEGNTIS